MLWNFRLTSDNAKRVEYESASCYIKKTDKDFVILYKLKSLDRRKGHATRLLELVTEWADQNKEVLVLTVNRYGKKAGLSNPQLKAFYERFGFVDYDDGEWPVMMDRKPKT